MPDTDKKDEKPDNLPEEVKKVLEELKVKLEDVKPKEEPKPTPAPAGPSWSEQRASRQKELGFNDAQMAAYERDVMERQGPIVEQLGWTKLEKKSDIETYRKDIEQELAAYPVQNRTPEVMEKIYYYVKGRHADSKPATLPSPKPAPGVAATRVSGGPGYSGAEPGLPAGGTRESNDDEANKLDEREKFVASKMGISEADYAKSRNAGKEIRELRLPDERPVNSLADLELRRLTGKK